jgi:hypothetical protein
VVAAVSVVVVAASLLVGHGDLANDPGLTMLDAAEQIFTAAYPDPTQPAR